MLFALVQIPNLHIVHETFLCKPYKATKAFESYEATEACKPYKATEACELYEAS